MLARTLRDVARPRGARGLSGRAWLRLGTQSIPYRGLDARGASWNGSLTLNELRKDVPARDVVGLGLHGRGGLLGSRGRSSVLPRGNLVLVSLGPVRAVLSASRVLLLRPDNLLARFAHEELEVFMAEAVAQGGGQEEDAFELLALEGILEVVTESYFRRVMLLVPVVEGVLKRLSLGSGIEIDALHHLVPLAGSLETLHSQIEEVLNVVEDLLANEDDMLELRLSERQRTPDEAQVRAEHMDRRLHERVELMLEHYHRELLHSRKSLSTLMRKVKGVKQLTSLSLDLYRNKVLRLELTLAISALSMATVGTVAGIWGMNVTVPFQDGGDLSPFFAIVGTSVAGGARAFALLHNSLFSAASKVVQQGEDAASVVSPTTLLSQMSWVDMALRKAAKAGGGTVAKDAFLAELSEVIGGDQQRLREADKLFELLDRSDDGFLQRGEWDAKQLAAFGGGRDP